MNIKLHEISFRDLVSGYPNLTVCAPLDHRTLSRNNHELKSINPDVM
ncbi:MAG: hypothetical protein IJQ73_10985 [Kiritimatiellae bacterium]|nr:hypothetical protein [Kiritimatiellia bacterium]